MIYMCYIQFADATRRIGYDSKEIYPIAYRYIYKHYYAIMFEFKKHRYKAIML